MFWRKSKSDDFPDLELSSEKINNVSSGLNLGPVSRLRKTWAKIQSGGSNYTICTVSFCSGEKSINQIN